MKKIIKYINITLIVNITTVFLYCSSSARPEELCLRVPLQDDTIQRMKAAYSNDNSDIPVKINDAAADDYIKTGFLLQEFYDDFKISGKKGPFIVLCLGYPVSGKSTILEQLRISLENSGKKVIKATDSRDKKRPSSGWADYKQMMEKYRDYDVLLFEATTSLPEDQEDVGLFIFMSIDDYQAANRYDILVGNQGAYGASKKFERYYTAKPYLTTWPDITIDTTNSKLKPEEIRDLIIAGMEGVEKRGQIRQEALRLVEEAYKFLYKKAMTEKFRDSYKTLILNKDLYAPVDGKKVLYIGNGFSLYPLIDAALGAEKTVVTDIEPEGISIGKFLNNAKPEIKEKVYIVNTPVDVEFLEKTLGDEKFDQVNAWNVLNDPEKHINKILALKNCISKIADGGGLWIINLPPNVVPELAMKEYGRKFYLLRKFDSSMDAYDLTATAGLCYYYQNTANPVNYNNISRISSRSL